MGLQKQCFKLENVYVIPHTLHLVNGLNKYVINDNCYERTVMMENPDEETRLVIYGKHV
jgi:hypothetical protein